LQARLREAARCVADHPLFFGQLPVEIERVGPVETRHCGHPDGLL